MFRHQGRGRTYRHNVKLASFLSCVAGFVNITGVLSINTLTTNITGHFAFFSEALFMKDAAVALRYLYFIVLFLLGAFTCSTLIELATKYKSRAYYSLPMIIEALILLLAAFSDKTGWDALSTPLTLACLLLFAMGLQNAFVTKISQSVVRTTHLTGLFTDLGIELSQLPFYRKSEHNQLKKAITLKISIIGGFFLGGIMGGLAYMHLELRGLLVPIGLLVFSLWYDQLLFRFYHIRRSFRKRRN